MKPSVLYRSELWRAMLGAAGALPPPVLVRCAETLASIYGAARPKRREIVLQNLLPAVQFDRAEAEHHSAALFRQFGRKLADLWLYESGRRIPELQFDPRDEARLRSAVASSHGCLILTGHIGNWELGAPFLKKLGIDLHVITQAEPHAGLTELREQTRARWGIKTIVLGENPFAFVEVIRLLERGGTVAVLVDRPVAASALTVKLFGHKFQASSAPAILARATGCHLLPVCIPRVNQTYKIELLPQITYDPGALMAREGRENLTQQIMRQFEPAIRQYLDQWYHFIPLWKES